MALLEATSTLTATTSLVSKPATTNLPYFSSGNYPNSGRGSGLVVGFAGRGFINTRYFIVSCWFRATPDQIDSTGSILWANYSSVFDPAILSYNTQFERFNFQEFSITQTGFKSVDDQGVSGHNSWEVNPNNFAAQYLDDAWHFVSFKVDINKQSVGCYIDDVFYTPTLTYTPAITSVNNGLYNFRSNTTKHTRIFAGRPTVASPGQSAANNAKYFNNNEFGGKIHFFAVTDGIDGENNFDDIHNGYWAFKNGYHLPRNSGSTAAQIPNDNPAYPGTAEPWVYLRAMEDPDAPGNMILGLSGQSYTEDPYSVYQVSESLPTSYNLLETGEQVGVNPDNQLLVNGPFTLTNFTINNGKIKFYDDDTLGLSITTAVNLIAGFLVEGEFRIRSNVAIGNNYTEADFVNQNFVDNGILTEILKLATCNLSVQTSVQAAPIKNTSATANPVIESSAFIFASRVGELFSSLNISSSVNTTARKIAASSANLTIASSITATAVDLDQAIISASSSMSVSAVAKKTASANVNIQTQLAVDITATDLDIAVAALLIQTSITSSVKKFAGTTVSLNAAASITCFATKGKFTSAALNIAGTVVANAIANRKGVVNAQIQTALSATAVDIDLATLSISSGLVVNAVAIKIARAVVNIDSSMQIAATGADLDLANLSISSTMLISAIAVKTARARITATATMDVTAVGAFFNVDPYYVYKILAETRLNTLVLETRAYKIMQETRDYKIRVPVLATPQTRRNS
jgi:hypothetical protein